MSTCARCGARFSCGRTDRPDDGPCWCMQLPVVPAETLASIGGGKRSTGGCFCPACLASAVQSMPVTPDPAR